MSDQPVAMSDQPEETPGTIRKGEYHPAANAAMHYINSIPLNELFIMLESFSSVALSGNRLAEICAETLNRVLTKQPLSDRYLLGLCWTIRDMRESKEE